MEDQGFLLAFVYTPLAVLALGYAAVRLHERALRKDDLKKHPAE
ncbi:hypothetical protein [Fertoeibacter niger]|nr:hypothetical protein [Fertoeibacter niger]